MATQYFLRGTSEFTDFDVAGASDRALLTSRGASASSLSTTLTSGGTQIQATAGAGGVPLDYYTPALTGGQTISGTVTFNVWASESAATVNATIACTLEVVDPLGVYVSDLVSLVSFGSELTTSLAAKQWTATPTNTTLSEGQRVRLRIYFLNIGTMGSGTGTLSSQGPTGGATGDSYVTFTETLTNAAMMFPPPGGATGAAGVPVLAARILPGVSSGSGSAAAPDISSQQLTPPTATGSGTGLVPSLTARIILTVVATATGAAGLPAVQAPVVPASATATGHAYVPTILPAVIAWPAPGRNGRLIATPASVDGVLIGGN